MTNETQFREIITRSLHAAQFLCKHLQEAHNAIVDDKQYNALSEVAVLKFLELMEQASKLKNDLSAINNNPSHE